MNPNGIYTSKEEYEKLPLSEYSFPEGEGSFEGALQFRRWAMQNKKFPVLFCYFITSAGDKLILPLYFNYVKDYSPWVEGPNFKFHNYDGEKFYCEYGTFPNGSTKWLVAKMITEDK